MRRDRTSWSTVILPYVRNLIGEDDNKLLELDETCALVSHPGFL